MGHPHKVGVEEDTASNPFRNMIMMIKHCFTWLKNLFDTWNLEHISDAFSQLFTKS